MKLLCDVRLKKKILVKSLFGLFPHDLIFVGFQHTGMSILHNLGCWCIISFLNPLYFYVTSSNILLSMDYLILSPPTLSLSW